MAEDVESSVVPSKKLIEDNLGQERSEHLNTLWCHFGNAALGLWLISSPFVFGLAESWMTAEALAAPSGRGLPLSATWMTASDVVTGLLILIFALLSLSRDYGWARWITALLGMWLLLAPLVFWTSSAAAYATTHWSVRSSLFLRRRTLGIRHQPGGPHDGPGYTSRMER